MKVLHVSAGNLYGGVEVVLATIAREQTCCPEMESHFALCFPGRAERELTTLGAPLTLLGDVQTRFPWQVWLARRRLAALLREGAFDVVVCHMAWVQAIFGPVVRRARLPLVFWMHDVAQGKHWIERWAALCSPDLAICNSHFTAGSLPKLFPGAATPPHEVVYCPVSPAAISLDPHERAAMRASLVTPSDACVIIQVGRMEPYKGHTLHLDALARLVDLPGWVCWIVGGAQRPHEHSYLASLKEQAAATGIGERVRFTGSRHDVPALLQAADVFCQPNLGPEPFGIVFIEALNASLPLVSTAQGGALEIVDEICGLLVPADDPAKLADWLCALITDASLRKKLGAAGPARASLLCEPARQLTRLRDLVSAALPATH